MQPEQSETGLFVEWRLVRKLRLHTSAHYWLLALLEMSQST